MSFSSCKFGIFTLFDSPVTGEPEPSLATIVRQMFANKFSIDNLLKKYGKPGQVSTWSELHKISPNVDKNST